MTRSETVAWGAFIGRPRVLDLFCGAGGAAMGYYRAGFDVVGVDNRPQPHYPFEFHQGDATDPSYVMTLAAAADVVHASPPCQRYTAAQRARGRADQHPNHVPFVRRLLRFMGLPYVIENVPGAPLENPALICGTSWGLGADGFELRRHRLFESSAFLFSLPCDHKLPAMPIFGHGPNADFYRRYGRGISVDLMREAMEIQWMNREELREAIPWRYTEFIGTQILATMRAAA